MAIITIEDLSAYSGATLDTNRAQDIVNAVNQWVSDYTGRFFGEVREVTEAFDYAPAIFLSHIDVQSVDSVKLYGQDITGNILANRATGRIVLRATPLGNNLGATFQGYDAIEVTYKSGMANVPLDLKNACLQLAMDNYNRKDGKDANVTSASLGSYHLTFGNANATTTQANASAGTQSAMTDYMSIFNFYRIRSL